MILWFYNRGSLIYVWYLEQNRLGIRVLQL